MTYKGSLYTLESCSENTDEGVGKLAEGCPQLSLLNLMGCFEVSDKGVGKQAACSSRCSAFGADVTDEEWGS